MWHAEDPRGPWSGTLTVKAVERWRTRPPSGTTTEGLSRPQRPRRRPLILHRMTRTAGRYWMTASRSTGGRWRGAEALQARGDYYISLPEGGVATGGQTVLRRRTSTGRGSGGSSWKTQPPPGRLVDLPNGDAWFVGFKSTATSAASATSCGEVGRGRLAGLRRGRPDGGPLEEARRPPAAITRPRTSDAFDGPALGPQWQWNHNPVAGAWSLAARPGWLRLARGPPPTCRGRGTRSPRSSGTTPAPRGAPRRGGMANGQRAGLTFISGSTFGGSAWRWRGYTTRLVGAGRGRRGDWDDLWLRGRYAGTRPARVQPRREDLHGHRCRVPAPLRPLEGRARRDLRLRADGTSTWTTSGTATPTSRERHRRLVVGGVPGRVALRLVEAPERGPSLCV